MKQIMRMKNVSHCKSKQIRNKHNCDVWVHCTHTNTILEKRCKDYEKGGNVD